MVDIHSFNLKFTHSLASREITGDGQHSVRRLFPLTRTTYQRSFAPEALHFLHRYYDLIGQSQGLSPTSLFTLAGQSLQLGPPAAGLQDLPDVTVRESSLDAWTFTPAASGVHLPVSSPRASAFPETVAGRRSAKLRTTTSVRDRYFGAAVIP
jgi:hypothetical protein